jgi:hypothetical protein
MSCLEHVAIRLRLAALPLALVVTALPELAASAAEPAADLAGQQGVDIGAAPAVPSAPPAQAEPAAAPAAEGTYEGSTLIPPDVEGDPHAAATGSYCFSGPHPVDTRVSHGTSWDETTGQHLHPYPPLDLRLFTFHEGCYYFIGDPRDFGYSGRTYSYYGAHPVQDVYGGGWCFMMGGHYHMWGPWSPHFTVVGPWYYWHGPYDPFFWTYWPYYSHYYRVYYPHYYGGGRFYRGGFQVAPPIRSVPNPNWRPGAGRGGPSAGNRTPLVAPPVRGTPTLRGTAAPPTMPAPQTAPFQRGVPSPSPGASRTGAMPHGAIPWRGAAPQATTPPPSMRAPAPAHPPVPAPAFRPPAPGGLPRGTWGPSHAPPSFNPGFRPSPAPAPSFNPGFRPSPAPAPSFNPGFRPSPAPSFNPGFRSSPAPSFNPGFRSSPAPSFNPGFRSSPAPSFRGGGNFAPRSGGFRGR